MAKKKKLSYIERRQKEEQVNTKAIIWISVAISVFIIALSILLAFNS